MKYQLIRVAQVAEKLWDFFWVLPGLFHKWSSQEIRSTKVLVHWVTGLTSRIRSGLITI